MFSVDFRNVLFLSHLTVSLLLLLLLFLFLSCPPFFPFLCFLAWFGLQATAPVSIPAGAEPAGVGSVNGAGPDSGITVSWPSPPVIFQGASSVSFSFFIPQLFCWQSWERSNMRRWL